VLALAFVTLITTVVSGADYLTVFTRRALATQANPVKQPNQAAF
jgi:hypothetical protein